VKYTFRFDRGIFLKEWYWQGKVKSNEPQGTHTAKAYPGFATSPLIGCLPGFDWLSQGVSQQYVTGTHLYNRVERDNVE